MRRRTAHHDRPSVRFISYTETIVQYPIATITSTVDPGGPVVIVLTTGSEVRGFKPGRGQWIFLQRKNSEYDFLREGSKAVGPVS